MPESLGSSYAQALWHVGEECKKIVSRDEKLYLVTNLLKNRKRIV